VATGAVETFVEDLSNWYVRHSRRRFWKGESDSDTRMAYETLYECLEVLVRLIAPFMPFTAEEIYQNLVQSHDENAPESVHHTDFPHPDERLIDQALTEEMRAAERLISLSLSARESAKIKVRQPLAKLTLGPADELEQRAAERFSALIAEDLNVKEVAILPAGSPLPEVPMALKAKPNLKVLGKRLKKDLKPFKKAFKEAADAIAQAYGEGESLFRVPVEGRDDVLLNRSDLLVTEEKAKDAALAVDGDTFANFDTVITEDLRIEGMMRELLRRLQVLRKEVGLEIEDRIDLVYKTESADIQTIFTKYGDYLKSELLALTITQAEAASDRAANIEIDKEPVAVQLTRKAP
jgi:isoleucyl-tRNA synthetase